MYISLPKYPIYNTPFSFPQNYLILKFNIQFCDFNFIKVFNGWFQALTALGKGQGKTAVWLIKENIDYSLHKQHHIY